MTKVKTDFEPTSFAKYNAKKHSDDSEKWKLMV